MKTTKKDSKINNYARELISNNAKFAWVVFAHHKTHCVLQYF